MLNKKKHMTSSFIALKDTSKYTLNILKEKSQKVFLLEICQDVCNLCETW